MGTVKPLEPIAKRKEEVARLVIQDGIIVACNDPALWLFQCERKDLLGRPFLDFSVPTQPNGRNSADALRLRTAAALAFQQQRFQWVCRRSDSKTFKAQATLERIRAREKTFTQLSLSQIKAHDPTEEALLKFRLGIERSKDAVFMTDVDGHIIYANPAFERTYGYKLEEVLGNTPRILKSGLLPQEVYKEFWQTLLNKEVVAGEIVNKTKSGDLVDIESTNNPIVDESGNLIGFLAIHRDISERKRAEKALQKTHEDLEIHVKERTAELARVNELLKVQYAELEEVKKAFEQRNQVLEALNELTRQTASSLELETIFQTLVNVTCRLIDCTSGYVSTIDLGSKTRTVVVEHISPKVSEAESVSALGSIYDLKDEIGNNLTSWMHAREVLVTHVDDPLIADDERSRMERYGVKSILAIVLSADEEPVAQVEFWESRQKREFEDEEIELVRAVAGQVSVSIQNARLYQRAVREVEERKQLEQQIQESYERRGRQVELSIQFAKDIAAATDLSDLYRRVVVQVKEQFGYYHTQLLRYEPSLNAIELIAGYGNIGKQMLAAGHKMPMGVGLIGMAAAAGRSVLRPIVIEDPDWRPNALLPDTNGELAVPIMLGEELLGVLDVQSDVAGKLNEDDQLVLEGLCGQIAIAIESTRLRQEMEDRLRELNHLQRIMSREGWEIFRAQREKGPLGYRFDRAAVREVVGIRSSNPSDEVADSIWDTQPLSQSPKKIVSLPMKVRGEVIGALGIRDDPVQPLSSEDRELLNSITDQVAEALESARLLEETQKHAVQMEVVAEVSAVASSILDDQELLKTVVDLTKERFGLYHVAIYTLQEELLHIAAKTWSSEDEQAPGRPLEVHILQAHSPIARAVRSRKPVVVNDVAQEDGYDDHPALPGTRSELAIPLLIGRQVLGVFDLHSESTYRFSQDDVEIQTTLAAQIAVALQNARLYAEQLEVSERLREVDRLKSEFFASMSHELRTPLNSIIGFADVLLEGIDGSLNERMEEDVTLIRDSGRHLRRLIGEILDMSKIEAGVMDLIYEEIDVSTLAEEIVANTRSLAKDKKLDIQLKLDSNLKTIEADRTRLTQILLNLMSNAVKFTEEGCVTLTFQEHNGHLVASVQDTGIGIRSEDMPMIFERFRQIDGSLTRAVGGTGLGIPISKSLVELHGGELWVESDPGVGSTFSFTIPRERSAKD